MPADQPEPPEPESAAPQPGTAEVARDAPGLAVVTLRGEHDLATRQLLNDALVRACDGADVLVDLSGCTFIDSTMIGELVLAYQAQTAAGRRLELTMPRAARAIRRLAEVAGLTTFMRVHETRADGVASLSRPAAGEEH
jgi:anti-sigma B factor antagonist